MVLVKEIKGDGSESTLESDDNLSNAEMENDSGEESIMGDSDVEFESDEEASDIESGDMEEDIEEEEGGSNSEQSDQEMDRVQNRGGEASDSSVNEEQHENGMSNDDSEKDEAGTTNESNNGYLHFGNSINLNEEELNVLEDDEEVSDK